MGVFASWPAAVHSPVKFLARRLTDLAAGLAPAARRAQQAADARRRHAELVQVLADDARGSENVDHTTRAAQVRAALRGRVA